MKTITLTFNETSYEFKYNSNYNGMDLYQDGKVVNSFGASESQFKNFTIVDFSTYIQKHVEFINR